VGNPPSLSSSHDSLLHASTPKISLNKSISVSFSAKQFGHFEHAIQEVNGTMSPIPDDCVIPNTMSPSDVSFRSAVTSTSRSLRPSLINSNVQDFSDFDIPMDVDIENASRKRALPRVHRKSKETLKQKSFR